MTKRKLELGQAVRARFQTLPSIGEPTRKTKEESCPVRDGTATFVHPQNRFACVTTYTSRGPITECFRPNEVMT